jgi:hypothetical protein
LAGECATLVSTPALDDWLAPAKSTVIVSQLIRELLEIDWDSDEVRIALELYEEIIAKGFATPRQIDAALDRYADAVAKGEAKKMTHYEWLKTTFVDSTRFQ